MKHSTLDTDRPMRGQPWRPHLPEAAPPPPRSSNPVSSETFLREHEDLLRSYRPHIPMRLERGSFVVKTLDDWAELKQALRLRHDIFHTEHHGRILPDAMEADELDLVCDHLGIFEKRSLALVGVYRLTSSVWTDVFYARRKFQLAGLLAAAGNKLELGRACVRRDFRDGITLQLLWRGILEYARLSSSDYLFGSASIRLTDAQPISLIYSYCRQFGYSTDEYPISVFADHLFPGLELKPEAEVERSLAEIKQWMPSLFRSYLKMGAKIATAPAIDPFMACADFLMIQPVCRFSGRFVARTTG